MIVLGFYRPEHSELPLIGFFFLFLLSLQIIDGDLQYRIGEHTNITYDDALNLTIETTRADYSTYSSHNFGYWLAVASAVGFAGVLYGLKKTKWGAS